MHNGVLYNSQEQETIQCPPVTEWMHKWRHSHTMEFYMAKSIPMINNHTQHVSDAHKFNVEWKKPDTNQHTLHDSIYLKDKYRDFPGVSVVKNPPANAGDTGSIPGLGRVHMLPMCHNCWAHMLQLLKLTCLQPTHHSKRSPCNEKTEHVMNSSPCSLQLEKAHPAKKP